MPKATVKNYKLKFAIIISLILHIIMFTTTLIYDSLNKHIEISANKYPVINAVALISSETIQKFNNNKQQQIKTKHTEEQFKNLHKKQHFSYSKHIKKEHLKTQKITYEQITQQKKTKDKIEIFKKTITKSRKKDTKPDIKNNFNKLNSSNNLLETENRINKLKEKVLSTKNIGMSDSNINYYVEQIKNAIENRFYDASSYVGKVCTLNIKLAPDGKLLNIQPEIGGDPMLCTVALAAARQAKIPRPPSPAVYEALKKIKLDFRP